VDLYLRAPAGRLPDKLEIDVKGLIRHRVSVYWDGCAYLV